MANEADALPRWDMGRIYPGPDSDAFRRRAHTAELGASRALATPLAAAVNLPVEDLLANERALRVGSRLFSAYATRTGERLWVIGERDRSVTTLLLPDEYRASRPTATRLRGWL